MDRRKLAATMVLLSLPAWPVIVRAATVYTYTGNPYNAVSGSYTTSMFLSGTVSLDNPLGPNLPLSDVSGLPGFSYSFFDGLHTLDSANSSPTFFDLGTDVGGLPDEWNFHVARTGPSRTQSASNVGGDLVQSGNGTGTASPPSGSWTRTGPVIPLPPAAALGLLGLGAVAVCEWKRRRNADAL